MCGELSCGFMRLSLLWPTSISQESVKPEHIYRQGQWYQLLQAGRRAEFYPHLEKPKRVKNLDQARWSTMWLAIQNKGGRILDSVSLNIDITRGTCSNLCYLSAKLCISSYPVILFTNILEIFFAYLLCSVSSVKGPISFFFLVSLIHTVP